MAKFAVITGASAGIGAEFARQLANDGYELLLVARRAERLRALAAALPTRCQVFCADLADPGECRRLLAALADRPIDLFVNNAGRGVCGPFVQTDLGEELALLDINVRALHILTKGVVRQLQRQGGGALLNVGSSAGLMPAGPYMAAYYASKAYVVSLTTALAEELRQARSPVYVGCLCPGPVHTEFNEVAHVRTPLPGVSPEFCVRCALAGVHRRKVLIVPGRPLAAAMAAQRLLPRALSAWLACCQQKRKLLG